MTLPVEGLPLHTRSLTMVATQQEEGRWRVLGQVIDLRKSSFVPMLNEAQTAGIIHHMRLDAVVDPATRVLESLDTTQPAVAVEASQRTGGESCRDPAPRLQALVGRRFDAELPAELGRVFGGPRGCSHLLTLFHLMASAVPRALDFEAQQLRDTGVRRPPGEKIFRRALFVDGTAPEEGLLQLAVQLTDFHDRPVECVEVQIDHLALQAEVRCVATVRLPGVGIEGLVARERLRTRETLGSAEWLDLGDDVAELVGRPLMPGLGKELRRRFGGRPERALLLDSLVQLAPGFVQCMPALGDRMLAGAVRRQQEGAPRRQLPSFMALGGAVDSCYMWRAGGPLLQIRPLVAPSSS